MNRTTLRGAFASAAIAAALVTITACGGQSAPAAPAPTSSAPTSAMPAGEHVDADVTFVKGMIPHHSQAVDMAKLAAASTTNPKVLDLAARIEKAQAPEIRTMQGFLTSWGMPAADTSGGMGGMAGMDHGGSPGGMMSDTQMQQLGQVRGAEFDRMFLTMMIEHHNGAVQMAETELASGRNAEAKKLAQAIIDAQRAEIAEMNTLLTSG